MGQVLHGSATTTHAIRVAIQRSKAPLKDLAAGYGLNQKTVAKWRKRAFVNDAPMGPPVSRSTVLSSVEEEIIVTFRQHTLLPLDDCLYALQATIPYLTRSSLHLCLKRHGISRLPEIAGEKSRAGSIPPCISWHFERDPIPYALETDWPVGAAGFEPLHIRIGICQDSQPGGQMGYRGWSLRLVGR